MRLRVPSVLLRKLPADTRGAGHEGLWSGRRVVIELTEEMLAAFLAAWDHENRVINDCAGDYVEAGGRDRAGIAAVLAIVERDLVAEVERLRREVERLTVAAYPYSCLGCGNRFTKAAAAAGCDEDHRAHAARAKRGTGSKPGGES